MSFVKELNIFGWSVPGTQQVFEGGVALRRGHTEDGQRYVEGLMEQDGGVIYRARVHEESGVIEQVSGRMLGWDFAKNGGERRFRLSPVRVTWQSRPQMQTAAIRGL